MWVSVLIAPYNASLQYFTNRAFDASDSMLYNVDVPSQLCVPNSAAAMQRAQGCAGHFTLQYHESYAYKQACDLPFWHTRALHFIRLSAGILSWSAYHILPILLLHNIGFE